MPTYRSITISLISQFDILTIPEYPPPTTTHPTRPHPPLIDATTSTVSVYIPTYPCSQFWVAYSVAEPIPPGQQFLFKLLIDDVPVVSWGCGPDQGYQGKTMFALFDSTEDWQHERVVERRVLSFPGEGKGRKKRHWKGFMEIRVYRCKGSKRVGRVLEKFSEKEAVLKEGGMRLVNAGHLEPECPQRFYTFALIDPLDQPFARFRYFYRTTTQLQRLGISGVGMNGSPSLAPTLPQGELSSSEDYSESSSDESDDSKLQEEDPPTDSPQDEDPSSNSNSEESHNPFVTHPPISPAPAFHRGLSIRRAPTPSPLRDASPTGRRSTSDTTLTPLRRPFSWLPVDDEEPRTPSPTKREQSSTADEGDEKPPIPPSHGTPSVSPRRQAHRRSAGFSTAGLTGTIRVDSPDAVSTPPRLVIPGASTPKQLTPSVTITGPSEEQQIHTNSERDPPAADQDLTLATATTSRETRRNLLAGLVDRAIRRRGSVVTTSNPLDRPNANPYDTDDYPSAIKIVPDDADAVIPRLQVQPAPGRFSRNRHRGAGTLTLPITTTTRGLSGSESEGEESSGAETGSPKLKGRAGRLRGRRRARATGSEEQKAARLEALRKLVAGGATRSPSPSPEPRRGDEAPHPPAERWGGESQAVIEDWSSGEREYEQAGYAEGLTIQVRRMTRPILQELKPRTMGHPKAEGEHRLTKEQDQRHQDEEPRAVTGNHPRGEERAEPYDEHENNADDPEEKNNDDDEHVGIAR